VSAKKKKKKKKKNSQSVYITSVGRSRLVIEIQEPDAVSLIVCK